MNKNLTSRRHGWAVATIIVALSVCLTSPRAVLADDAEVLPDGVSRVHIDFYRYHPTTHRFNADGDRERLAHPFTNATLDSSVLTSLEPLDPFVPGLATIGDVSVVYEYDIDVLDIGYAYGVTENLSIGIHIPYYWIKNNVDTAFDNSNANVGLHPVTGECCIPIALGGVPMEEQDVQNLVMDEYGFSEIDDWSRDGIGDTELGAKYRFLHKRDSAMAITGGLRIPTGYEDDPDKLNDVAWSYGTYALLFRLHYDYLLSNLWKDTPSSLHQQVPAAGDLVGNLTFRYDYMFPDTKTMRIGDTPDQVLTNNRERVDRELGDIYNLEAALRYHATRALALGLVYTYGGKFKDSIDGDRGYNYSSLEKNTDSSQQIIKVEASYSTLPAYLEKESRMPMEFSLAYRERFKGDGPSSGQANPVLYTRWVTAGVKFWF